MVANIIYEQAYLDMELVFKDRVHAGELLAEKLRSYAGKKETLVLAIPAGGVPVGHVLAKKLHIPFDVLIVRKIQIPWNTEAGFGAVTSDDITIFNEPLMAQLRLTKKQVEQCRSRTLEVVKERIKKLRGDTPFPELVDKTVILVDDGLASGFTMLAAVKSVRRKKSKKVVVAVPTASKSAIELVAPNVDELICLNIRSGPIFAVADAYRNWYDLSDDEVIEILKLTSDAS